MFEDLFFLERRFFLETLKLKEGFSAQFCMLGFFFFNFIYLVLVALALRCCAQAFSSCGEWGYSSFRCTGFSLQWPLLLRNMGSRHAGFSSCGLRALEHRFSSCGTWA